MESTSIVDRVYAAKGDSAAADSLIRDYLPFIKAQTYKVVGRMITDEDDELSIAMIAFHEAIESYSRLRGAFLPYASLVMERKLIDFFRKEKRHMGQLSIDVPVMENEDATYSETLEDQTDAYGEFEMRDATRAEIMELTAQLQEYGITLNDIADNSPKQERTLESCQLALAHARAYPAIIEEFKRTKKLPLKALAEGSGVERKTLERHRKYMMALLLIFSNGYEIIRGHLKQIVYQTKGGLRA
ncbi:MAG TPA: RNA polymerase subunit sigma [Tissierellia bacterium]|nr:RNA polymerase subunit sigma [Tissierellia bacterium]